MTTALLAIVVALLAGAAFLLITHREADVFGLLGSSVLIGFILVALAMLILSVGAIGWTPLTVPAVTLLLLGGAIVMRSSDPRRLSRPRLAWGDVPLLALIAVHTLYVTESAPRDRDYWGIYGLKAKVFAEGGQDLGWQFLTDSLNTMAHIDYPPLLNFMYGWLASWQGVWNDRWFGLLEAAFVAALALVVRSRVALFCQSAAVGSWTAAIVALSVMQTRFGIADVPLTVFVTSGLLVLQHAISSERDHDAQLGFLLLGGGALTKNEGLAFLMITIVVALLWTRRWRFVLLSSLPGVVVAAFWQVPRLMLGLRADVAEEGGVGRMLVRVGEVDWLVTLVRTTPPVMIAALVGLAVAALVARMQLRRAPLLLLVPAAQLLVYLAVYASSPHPSTWHVATSWDRIALHIAVPWLVAGVTVLVERVIMDGSDFSRAGRASL